MNIDKFRRVVQETRDRIAQSEMVQQLTRDAQDSWRDTVQDHKEHGEEAIRLAKIAREEVTTRVADSRVAIAESIDKLTTTAQDARDTIDANRDQIVARATELRDTATVTGEQLVVRALAAREAVVARTDQAVATAKAVQNAASTTAQMAVGTAQAVKGVMDAHPRLTREAALFIPFVGAGAAAYEWANLSDEIKDMAIAYAKACDEGKCPDVPDELKEVVRINNAILAGLIGTATSAIPLVGHLVGPVVNQGMNFATNRPSNKQEVRKLGQGFAEAEKKRGKNIVDADWREK